MKIPLVPCILLLFGVSLNSGHYLRIPENGYPYIYEKELSPGISLVNPKPLPPTLRDIVYVHMIERPREEPAITERSFTNSHGYQFLDQGPFPKGYEEKELNYKQDGHTEENLEYNPEKEDTWIYEEKLEPMAAGRPLTDKDVKEAYKSRSYLYDQSRQRYAVKRVAGPYSSKRRRRQAETQQIPDAPSLSANDADDFPRTYGMNLNPEGGYVWNNLNKPGSFYELPSNGNTNEGPYESAQSQENTPLPNENAFIPPETGDSASSEDIYVNGYRPSTLNVDTVSENENPEVVNDDPAPINENRGDSEAENPVEPILGNDEAESKEGFDQTGTGPEVFQNSGPSYPVDPIIKNPGPNESTNSQEIELPQEETPVSEGTLETVKESNENPGYGYASSEIEEPKAKRLPEEIPEDDTIEVSGPVETVNKSNENLGYGYGEVAVEEPKSGSLPEESPEVDKIAVSEPIESLKESNENLGYGYGQAELEGPKSQSIPEEISDGDKIERIGPVDVANEPKSDSLAEESPEGDEIKEVPEAPTLSPLNYDNLPGYIRNAISSTEKPSSYEQTDNPYINPQLSPNDEKAMHGKMEDIFATVEPIEEISRTYGMNLTSEGGRVWNGLVDPPVSYDVGLPSNSEEDHKDEPEHHIPEPAEPAKETTINPEELNQEPETNVSEEAKNPTEENIPPQEPETEGKSEIPIRNPDQVPPVPDNEPQPPENEDKSIKEPAQPVEPVEPEATVELRPIPPQEPETESEFKVLIPNPDQIRPVPDNEPQPPENEDKSIEEPAQPVQPVEPEATVEPRPIPPQEPETESEVPIPNPDQVLPIPDNEPQPPENEDKSIEEPAQPVEPEPTVEPEPIPPQEPETESDPEIPFPNPDEVSPVPDNEPQPPENEDKSIEEPAQPVQPVEPEATVETRPIPPQEPEIESEVPIPNPDQLPPIPDNEPQFPENEDKSIEEPAGPVDSVEPEPTVEPGLIPPQEPETERYPEASNPNPDQVAPVPDNEPQPPENEDLSVEEPAQPVESLEPGATVDPQNPQVIPCGNENNQGAEGTEQPGDAEQPNEDNGDQVGEPETGPVEEMPEEENNKPDIMSELLKSEQFWKWLGEWTGTYIELLEKHMRKIVVQEICKREKSGEQMCPLEDPEDDGVIIRNGKIIVDGREIDITHTDNLNSELKGHYNNKHENKGSKGNKIEANNIFGNSVGNEKVTNVFIFTSDNVEEVIDKLKPSNDTEVNVVIDERIQEESKDETNQEKPVEDLSNVEEANIDDANKETIEANVDTEELNNEEANIESFKAAASTEVTKESNEDEVIDELAISEANAEQINDKDINIESNESDAIKESDISKVNTEQLNNEDNIESNEREAINTSQAKMKELNAGIIEKEYVKENLNRNKNIESTTETKEDLNKKELVGTSGDIGDLDEANIESKLDSSETNSNVDEFLESKY